MSLRRADLDTISKETIGLPVFISQGTTISSSTSSLPTLSSPASPNFARSTSTSSRPASLLANKRVSAALDFALASWDAAVKTAETLLKDDLPPAQYRHNDLESGGQGMGKYGTGKGVEDWLD